MFKSLLVFVVVVIMIVFQAVLCGIVFFRPSKLATIEDNTLRSWAQEIHRTWLTLGRKVRELKELARGIQQEVEFPLS